VPEAWRERGARLASPDPPSLPAGAGRGGRGVTRNGVRQAGNRSPETGKATANGTAFNAEDAENAEGDLGKKVQNALREPQGPERGRRAEWTRLSPGGTSPWQAADGRPCGGGKAGWGEHNAERGTRNAEWTAKGRGAKMVQSPRSKVQGWGGNACRRKSLKK
jgi:hypothetical protein